MTDLADAAVVVVVAIAVWSFVGTLLIVAAAAVLWRAAATRIRAKHEAHETG